MNINKLIKEFMEKFRKGSPKETASNVVILFLIAVLIFIVFSFFSSDGSKSTVNSNLSSTEQKNNASTVQSGSSTEYEKQLNTELKSILEQIQGVGRVSVMIYFDSGEEQVPALNTNNSTTSTTESDNEGGKRQNTQKNDGTTVVITNDGSKSEPLIIKTNKPKITGVCVVAEGAEHKVIALSISKAVVNLFEIPDNKVTVYPMKK